MKVLILGGTGMLGHQIIKGCISRNYDWYTTVRNKELLINFFGQGISNRIIEIDDIKNFKQLREVCMASGAQFIINCIGVVKQSKHASNFLESISVNSLLPHILNEICENMNAKLIHISTDCVFDGAKGLYNEDDISNAYDIYGKSKFLGEVNYGNSMTLRTSIIGNEITQNTHGLIDWFLVQKRSVSGYKKAIFSGVTTFELTKIILDVILPKYFSVGLFQIASKPISKYDLLNIVARVYNKDIEIVESQELMIDRSLSPSKFFSLTNYSPPEWDLQINQMKENSEENVTIK
jgi:dTDP-4-dehydrorhamnose reductase